MKCSVHYLIKLSTEIIKLPINFLVNKIKMYVEAIIKCIFLHYSIFNPISIIAAFYTLSVSERGKATGLL